MKQGILITAFNEFALLTKLINCFDDDFSLFIFLDKKSKFSRSEVDLLSKSKNVVFLTQEFNVNWGSYKQLKSRLVLAEEAVKYADLEYFHFITGQDYPLKSCAYIKDFLTQNKGKEFLQNSELPLKGWAGNGGFDRINYYHLHDYIDCRSWIGKRLNRESVRFQKALRIFRKTPPDFPKLFGGSPFWTLSYPCLKFVIDFTKENPKFLKRFEFCHSVTEIYFHTIIMNSPFKDHVVNRNYRYIDYELRGKAKNIFPTTILDDSDYERLLNTDALFGRKFSYQISNHLIQRIDKELLNLF